MPLQNRVLPTGEIVSHPARGLFMGGRGILHNECKRLGVARWRYQFWLICSLEYKGKRQEIMKPGRYTQLFFLDEAVALAAGHRPCALCRREAFNRFKTAWMAGQGLDCVLAPDIDKRLHKERVVSRTRVQKRYVASLDGLPDGTYVFLTDESTQPYLVLGSRLFPFMHSRYGDPVDRIDSMDVQILTPASTVVALSSGYRPVVHPSAMSSTQLGAESNHALL
jgi:hypothetical protein